MAKKPSEKSYTEEQHMSAFGGHPLQFHIEAYKTAAGAEPAGPIQALAEIGVTDAEQLVALSAIPDVRGKIAETIGVGKAEFESLVRAAKKVLPPPTLAELEHPLPSMFGLGAME